MRPLRALAVFIVVVFIGGALLAPWLYWLAQHFADEFPKLAHSPFHRFVHRSILGLALAGIWPLLKSAGVAIPRPMALFWAAGQWRRLGVGFFLGLVSLAIVAGLALALGARQFNTTMSPGLLTEKIVGIAGAAILVAVLEEVLFRGAIFGALRKVFHWVFALMASSVLYAIVHFLQSAEVTGAVNWHSGLELLPRMLRGFGDLNAFVPGFFNLTLAGLLLGLAYERTGDLFLSIGLHAGWIFWLKLYTGLTREVAGTAGAWWGSKIVDGWFAMPVLAVTLLVFARLSTGRKKGFHI
jgi:membrane protease YdiL (CAAX protease family)